MFQKDGVLTRALSFYAIFTPYIMKGECINMFKRFLEYALMGAGTYIGYFAMRKGINIATDPVKKAEVKNKFNKIKDTIKS